MPVEESITIIDVKKAVNIASEYVSYLFDDKVYNLRLEEVEISDKEDFWYVTLSFEKHPPIGRIPQHREYKKIKINAVTGKVKSVTVRNIDAETRP